jgi:hypothetical protein
VFGPNGPHLLIGRELTTSGGGFGGRYDHTFFRQEGDSRRFFAAGKLKHNAGNVVLSVRWKAARRFKRLV